MPTYETPGVYVAETGGPPPMIGVATAVTAFVGRTRSGPLEPTTIHSFGDFQRQFGGAPSADGLGWLVAAFFANGGGHAVIVRLVEPGPDPEAPLSAATLIGDRAARTGLYALEAVGDFNILCIPPDPLEGDTPVAVLQAAAAYCVERRAMLIIDPPTLWKQRFDEGRLEAITPADLGVEGEAARNAAVYFPRVLADPSGAGDPRELPACGAIAGLWADTDATRGVWKAPAGIEATLKGVASLAVKLTDADNGVINPLGVNALRTFPVYGDVVWGARTLRGADALNDDYRYIPVRRLALYVESSLLANLGWTVFEPNSPALWSQVRAQVSSFLIDLWRQGAFFGQTADDAVFVTCDQSTTTPDDIDNGVVNLVIGFAPVKPAEFVVLTLQLRAATPSG